MPFSAETVYLTLEGGIVLPITGVTDEKTSADVEVFDGSTYRNLLDAAVLGRAWTTGVTAPFVSGGEPEGADDRLNATVPFQLMKKRTLYSFPRSGKFTHIVWADLIQGTSPVPPYRIGMTPTPLS